MPTLLEFCKIPVPDTSEGENLFGERKRQVLFGEISKSICMANYQRFALHATLTTIATSRNYLRMTAR